MSETRTSPQRSIDLKLPHKKKIFATIVILVFVALWFLLPFAEWSKSFSVYARSQGAWGFIVFCVVYVLATLLMFPVTLLTIAMGIAYGYYALIGAVASATVGAALSYFMGKSFLRAHVNRWMIKHQDAKIVQRAVDKRGWRMALFMRLSPILPFGFINYFLGTTKIGFPGYFISTFLGILPTTLLYVHLGHAGVHQSSIWQWALFGAGILATSWIGYKISKDVRKAYSQD